MTAEHGWLGGSSPRMRGKHGGQVFFVQVFRIIPAHAGQTSSSVLLAMAHADHPRACGANWETNALSASQFGSSPRMRGKHGGQVFFVQVFRIIPAHAGQTIGQFLKTHQHADHPRACGANIDSDDTAKAAAGSSPRMRGKHDEHLVVDKQTRIIPAHAGQTRTRTGRVWPQPDHPRACGANSNSNRARVASAGSSPRMRGKPSHTTGRTGSYRIIPAHAGQTV